MVTIERIVIKGASGYCCIDEAFNDKVIITPGSISYEYVPAIETEINPKRKWRYITNGQIFKMTFENIAEMLAGIIDNGIDEICTDVREIEINVTYSDKTRFKEIYWVTGDYFQELFRVIKKMVPECEDIPAVLLTSEDYEEDDDE